jgi:phosphoenolpyruvate carboxylase
MSGAEIAALLPSIRVEAVLTAHPTEAKRATALGCHRELYLLLVRSENQMWTPLERRQIREEIKGVLERLWRAGEILIQKPDVTAELRNVVHYLREVFPNALPVLDARLRAAWEESGFDAAEVDAPERLPRLAFGDWVGGDRDGHPFVTAEVTAGTLRELRSQRWRCCATPNECRRALESSELLQEPPASFSTTCALSRQLGERGEQAVRRNPQEPWRQLTNLIVAQLPPSETATHLLLRRSLQVARRSFSRIWLFLRESLLKAARHGSRAWNGTGDAVVETFGFHLAALDVRENSRCTISRFSQLLEAAALRTRTSTNGMRRSGEPSSIASC